MSVCKINIITQETFFFNSNTTQAFLLGASSADVTYSIFRIRIEFRASHCKKSDARKVQVGSGGVCLMFKAVRYKPS